MDPIAKISKLFGDDFYFILVLIIFPDADVLHGDRRIEIFFLVNVNAPVFFNKVKNLAE